MKTYSSKLICSVGVKACATIRGNLKCHISLLICFVRSFQCRGVLLHLHIVGQGPAVLAAGAGRVGYIFYIFFIYLPFLMSCLLGDD